MLYVYEMPGYVLHFYEQSFERERNHVHNVRVFILCFTYHPGHTILIVYGQTLYTFNLNKQLYIPGIEFDISGTHHFDKIQILQRVAYCLVVILGYLVMFKPILLNYTRYLVTVRDYSKTNFLPELHIVVDVEQERQPIMTNAS